MNRYFAHHNRATPHATVRYSCRTLAAHAQSLIVLSAFAILKDNTDCDGL